MNKEHILKECIKIAVKNGWGTNGLVSDWIEGKNDAELDEQGWYIPYEGYWLDLNSLLFNHEFCRKLFGEEGYMDGWYRDLGVCTKHWAYHIQQLAISEDRIEYLGEWLKAQKL